MMFSRPYLLILLVWLPIGPVRAGDIYVGLIERESVVLSNVDVGDNYALLVRGPTEPATEVASAPMSARDGVHVQPVVLERSLAYVPLVEEAARETRVDPKLLQAVIATESGYNPVARSRKGAQGLMQLMPATARRYGVANAYEPRHNILGGARYLADLLVMFDQDVQLALAAYNAGEQAVLRHGRKIPPFRETIAYVPRVMKYYRAFSRQAY